MQLDPTWDSTTSYLDIRVVDVDGELEGDSLNDEVGEDVTQTAAVYDSAGNALDSGRIYAEDRYTLSDGEGNTVHVYVLEIGGVVQGLVSDPAIVPGVSYTITAIDNVDSAAGTTVNYADLDWSHYDPDQGVAYDGGANDDVLKTGAGNDTITSGAGADWIEGGTAPCRLSGSNILESPCG